MDYKLSFDQKREVAKRQRYKKPLIKGFSYDDICEALEEVEEAADNMIYYETLENGMEDACGEEEDELRELSNDFASISADAYQLLNDLRDLEFELRHKDTHFDDFVFLFRNKNEEDEVFGWDSVEKDYFGLPDWMRKWSEEEVMKRLMTISKKDLLYNMSLVSAILFSFVGIQNRFENLRAIYEIYKSKYGNLVKDTSTISEVYELWQKEPDNFQIQSRFTNILSSLPKEAWIA